MHALRPLVLVALCLLAIGCHGSADNPSFALTRSEARDALRRMADDPVPLERPVVVAAGLWDPGFSVHGTAEMLRDVTTTPEFVVEVPFFSTPDFDAAVARIVDKVEERFPSDGSDATREVDVVGISMGGLVARYAAEPRDGERRLAIRRLYTLASPHDGAERAKYFGFVGGLVGDMHPDSSFMAERRAAAEELPYEIVAYVRLGDDTVGEDRAAAPDGRVWWLSTPFLEFPHFIAHDPRILADVARRLRGETPYTTEPPAPFPSVKNR